MKFICEKQLLLKAINSVINGIATKRDTILEGILITAKNNKITLTTFNEEIGIECTINNEIVDEGATVVKSHTFSEIIRRLPDTEIEITHNNETNLLNIKCEGSNYKLATMNADDFPQIPKVQPEYSLNIAQKDLRNIIKQTIFSVGNDEKRILYTGSLFDVDNNKLSVVAVDGYRLAIRRCEVKSTSNFKMVIPGKTLQELSKILNDSFDEVEIGFSDNQAIFEFDNCKLTTKLLEGEYLRYNDIANTPTECRIKVNNNLIADCFERIMLISSSNFAKEKKQPVYIKLEVEKLTISCESGVGIAKEEILLKTEGRELSLKFNPKFFVDVLKNIIDEEVIIDFGSSTSPTIIRPVDESDEFTYIILPIKPR